MRINRMIVSVMLSFAPVAYGGSSQPTVNCLKAHSNAVAACAAHEHSVSADALTIVSLATRERVIRREEEKLESLKAKCLKIQEQCALTCDEEVESASLDGEDLSQPLDKLTDCRQGEVAKHLRAMDRKLVELRR